MWNTISLNLLNLAFVFTAPILFAILMNEISKNKFKRVVQTISYLPHFLSTVVVVSMVTTFLSPSLGALNNIIRSFGGTPIHFLGQARFFQAIMVNTSIWQGIGWGSIIYLSALSGIDQEQYEAAVVDGASRFQQIWNITLPGISNTIIILLILQIGSLLSVGVERVWLLQNAQNLRVSEVLSTYIFRMGLQNFNFGLSTAVGLFNGVISLFLVFFANRISKRYSDSSLM
jgi:putative aldouronate transport system permease protein